VRGITSNEMAKIFEMPLKYLLPEEERIDIAKNPILRNLLNRVSRLEKLIK